MAGKITIRRVGSMVPTVCLLLFLTCCVGLAWLSTRGLPDFAVRFLERKAAEQGVYLKIDELRLDPMHGVAVCAKDLHFYTDAEHSDELGNVRDLAAGLSLRKMLAGELRASFMRVSGVTLTLPVTDPVIAELPVQIESVELDMNQGDVLRVANGRLNVMGVPVKLTGSLDPAALPENEAPQSTDQTRVSSPPNLAETIERYQGVINRIYSTIHDQKWKSDEVPSLNVHVDWLEEPRVALQANVPSYDVGPFHFRDAVADLSYDKQGITINSLQFRTVDPEASASLRGAYDLRERHLAFNVHSTAALVRMLHHVGSQKTRAFLEKFRHPDNDPPDVRLSGDVVFEEDFTLRSAQLRGHVLQKNLMVGETKVDELELSFFYDNGDFNIDKLELRFPEGSLQALASAKNRKGQAQLAADLPIQKMLTLVNELSPVPVELPEGLELGERVQLQLQAQLDAPSFKPGQNTWQDFVPSFHMLGAWLSTDKLTYVGYHLDKPRLQVRLAKIRQKASYLPEAIQQVELALEAASADLPLSGGGQPVHIAAPHLTTNLGTLSFNEDGWPNSAESAALSAAAESVTYASDRTTEEAGVQRTGDEDAVRLAQDSVEGNADEKEETTTADEATDSGHDGGYSVLSPRLELEVMRAKLPSFHAPETLSIEEARVRLKTGRVQAKDVQVESAELLVDELRQITPIGELSRLFSAGRLQAGFNEVKYGERDMGKISLSAELSEYTSGHVALQIAGSEDGDPGLLSARPDWSVLRQITLKDVQMQVPAELLEMMLNIAGVQVNEVEVPDLVRVNGKLRLTPGMQVQDAELHAEIPKLVRTPQHIVAFRGKRIPVSLAADVTARRTHDSKDLLYDVHLNARHATGDFVGQITGSTVGELKVTGHNAIRPDIVDQLIDNKRAHSIIRDFRFTGASKAAISDISVLVNYANGVQVDSFCRVDLRNTEYQMSGILEQGDGTERVCTDLPLPFVLVNRATCGVSAHVRIGCKTPKGTPMPDETVVTITDPMLLYNNAPWLRCNKWDAGTRETKLSGSAVVIDVEHSFLELRNVGGIVYPAYSLGMFYPELYGFLEDVVLPHPAEVRTNLCVFPIYSDCVRPMSGVISVQAAKNAGFRFIGTTIPLDGFSGFISLSDDAVLLDRMNALSWEGVINAMVSIGIKDSKTSFDGMVRASCMNMKKIAKAYGSKQSAALCSGEIRFRSPDADLDHLNAYGRVDIEDGDLMSLSLFRPVGELITDLPKHLQHLEKQARGDKSDDSSPGFFMSLFSRVFRSLGKLVGRTGGRITNTASNIPGMNHLISYDLKEAHADFQIANGHIFTNNMKAIGSNLNVRLNADIDLDTLHVRGDLWPKISSLPTVLLSPVTVLSDFMMDIELYGPLEDIKWRVALGKSLKKKQADQQKKNTKTPPPAAAHQ